MGDGRFLSLKSLKILEKTPGKTLNIQVKIHASTYRLLGAAPQCMHAGFGIAKRDDQRDAIAAIKEQKHNCKFPEVAFGVWV